MMVSALEEVLGIRHFARARLQHLALFVARQRFEMQLLHCAPGRDLNQGGKVGLGAPVVLAA